MPLKDNNTKFISLPKQNNLFYTSTKNLLSYLNKVFLIFFFYLGKELIFLSIVKKINK